MPFRTKQYGWVPDLPDHRDHLYAPALGAPVALPKSVDLRPQCPAKVYNQGQLGSCTANAIAAAYEFDLIKQGATDFMPSRLFIYYNERAMEGTVGEDAGAAIRDGIKSVNKQGVCKETTWPYSDADPGPFQDKPSVTAYAEGQDYRALAYSRIPRSLRSMKTRLASGFPFVFGFTVYESFESSGVASTGVVPMPAANEEILGGHAVLAVGYDEVSQRFIVRNSWGPGWGDKGYFTMPYAYLLDENLSDDFWAIRVVEG
jgi:C1A family cysteine protease